MRRTLNYTENGLMEEDSLILIPGLDNGGSPTNSVKTINTIRRITIT